MTKQEFSAIAQNYLYLDGATGSNLVKAGMPSGVCPEQWILEHAEVMLDLQKRYVAAGTNILYAPTFTANRVKLAEYGLEEQIKPIIRKLVEISREAVSGASHPVYIAGDLTMTGELLKPADHDESARNQSGADCGKRDMRSAGDGDNDIRSRRQNVVRHRREDRCRGVGKPGSRCRGGELLYRTGPYEADCGRHGDLYPKGTCYCKTKCRASCAG